MLAQDKDFVKWKDKIISLTKAASKKNKESE